MGLQSIESTVDELWDYGFREPDIAKDLGMSQYAVLCLRRGKPPLPDEPAQGTEVRYATEIGWGGSMTCRRVPVTLAFSGTLN